MEIRGGKQFRTKQERREIVEETLKAEASVSRVARAHDVNVNQVFHWRRQYREGWLEEAVERPTGLVPVRITAAINKSVVATARVSKPAASRAGSIDIDLGDACVRIEGAADLDCVRAALEGLVR